MEETLVRFRNRFPTLPKNMLRKIYDCRLERMKVFTHLRLLKDVCWIIEAKVWLASEIHESFVKSMSRMRRNSYSKKRRAKRMRIFYKCTRWTCDKCSKSQWMISINRDDKIHFIKDELSKESLDNIIQAFNTYPSGYVHRVLLDLVKFFNKEKECYSLRNLMLKDPICQFIRKLDGKQILDS